MKKDNKLPTINGFDGVFFIVGVGLVFVGLLELFGLMRYKPGREPLGAMTWLIMGGFCLLIGIIIRKLRSL
jgi:amino acid transporter